MATTFLVTKNRAVSTLAAGINDAVTSLDVAAGEGTKFPSSYPFHITIDDEIMSCTNRSTDTLTVVRAEQGTVAAAHSTAASVSLNITAKNVSDLNTAVNAIENQVAYGRLDGWTADKFLKGAGAGSNPTEVDEPAGKTIVTGTYAGNNSNSRQITVGLKCSRVEIHGDLGSGLERIYFLIPGMTMRIVTQVSDSLTWIYLHASDGFVVEQSNTKANQSGITYQYWAISE